MEDKKDDQSRSDQSGVPIADQRGDQRHGFDCPKVLHVGGGYLHAMNDDSPYDVDGVSYCGRCHAWIPSQEPT